MFNPQLNSKTAEIIGKELERKIFIYSKDTTFVRALRGIHSPNIIDKIDNFRINKDKRYSECIAALHTRDFTDFVNKYIESYSFDFRTITIVSYAEALGNSIMHGSNYGRNGSVYSTWMIFGQAALIYIDDPGKGFGPGMKPKDHNANRGKGLNYMNNYSSFDYGIEKTRYGFRTILLYKRKK